MTRLALPIAFLVSLSACASPTSPASSPFTLSGTVYDVQAHPLAGVSVTIMDGIHAGLSRDTDKNGAYSFSDLTPSTFTLQARDRTSGLAENKAVNLTSGNRSVDFQLINWCLGSNQC
jgi:hypothetical protein